MDCTRCDELLLDLAYGELDDATASAVREHADGCVRCTAARADLSLVRDACRAIELPEPPLGLDARILAAAEAAVAPARERAEAPRHIVVDRPGLWISRFVDSFAALAMKPQMAMAAVLVVVVGVAVLIGNEARMTSDEAVPSLALRAPAAPALDPLPSVTVSPIPPPPAVPGAVSPSRAPAEPALRPLDDTERDEAGARADLGREQRRPHDGSSDRRQAGEEVEAQAPARRLGEGGDAITKSAPAQTQAGPSGAGGGAGTGSSNAEARSRSALQAPAPMGGAMANAEDAAGAERSEADGGRAAFESGIGNYNRGRYRDAADDLGEFVSRPGDATSLLPTARITRARSLKNIGQCGEAVREYEEYLRRWGTGGSAADARVEAADCYTRLGQTTRARELYSQAENQGGAPEATRARARRSRVAIDAAEASSPSTEPSAAEQAAPIDADQGF